MLSVALWLLLTALIDYSLSCDCDKKPCIVQRTNFSTPEFKDGQSFENCGLWDQDQAGAYFAPWNVLLKGPTDFDACFALIVSPTTVLTFGCEEKVEKFQKPRTIKTEWKVLNYQCYLWGKRKCNDINKRQIQVKNATSWKVSDYNPETINVWTIEKLELDSLYWWPICISGQQQQRNAEYESYHTMWDTRSRKRSELVEDFAPCLKEEKADVKECSMVKNNHLCAKVLNGHEDSTSYLVQREGDRFFLKSILQGRVATYKMYLDISPYLEKLASDIADIHPFPAAN